MSKDESGFLFSWKIKPFNFFSRIYCECLSSPKFRVKSLEESEWKICLFPRTISEDIECRLERLEDSTNKDIVVRYRYQIASSDGVVLKSSNVFSQTFQGGSCSETYRLKELFDTVKEILKYPNDILVFRCYLANSHESMSPTSRDTFMTGCEVETDVSCHTPSYVWSFKFSNVDGWSVSKQIKLDGIPIEIILKYIDDKIQIELFSVVEDDWTHHFTCDIELINAIGNQIISGEGDYEFNKENKIWKFPNFISKQHLEQAHCFLRQEIRFKFNLLRLYSFISKISYCSGKLEYGQNSDIIKNTSSDSELQSTSLSDPDCLEYYSQNYFENASFAKSSSDVKLRMGNDIFHVHKPLLAKQSVVFLEMFVRDAEKGTSGIIDVNDMELETLKIFLTYIYTGMLNEIDVETTLDLLMAAESYQALELVEKCSSFLENSLTSKNACRILFVADMIQSSNLKSCVLDFIVSEPSNILSTSEWTYWIERNIHLATEVFLKLSQKFTSES